MNVRCRVGHAIKVRRAVLGMKQADLAEAAGLSRAMISLVEAGKRGVDLDVLDRLAMALDLPACVLVGYGDTLANGLASHLTNAITKASPAHKEAVP